MDKGIMTLPTMIETARMRLVAVTPELARDQVDNPDAFFASLGVESEPAWPPELVTDENLRSMSDQLAGHPEQTGWHQWVYVLPVLNRLIGVGGFQGGPNADGEVEIGYSMLSSYREQGLATEGVEALLGWAYGHDSVRSVIAHTGAERTAAQRVLEKAGFRIHEPADSTDAEPVTLEYRHVRGASAS
jgi:ribosomal-protein-alanine N-acetyltransferase